MSPVTTPRAHSLLQLEAVRQQLAEAAELAADAHGVVDTQRVADAALRRAFEKIAGTRFTTAAFAQRLDRALDALDRADGRGRSIVVQYPGLRGIEDRAAARRAAHRRSLVARIAAFVSGPAPNFTLGVKERARVESGSFAVQAVLSAADAASKSANEALAQRHFTGEQRIDFDTPLEAFLRGDAGALTDIDAVMVKHQRSGTWCTASVAADGSYALALGTKDGEMSVWYQRRAGEKFFGGNVMVRVGNETIGRANWVATPHGMPHPPPLAFTK